MPSSSARSVGRGRGSVLRLVFFLALELCKRLIIIGLVRESQKQRKATQQIYLAIYNISNNFGVRPIDEHTHTSVFVRLRKEHKHRSALVFDRRTSKEHCKLDTVNQVLFSSSSSSSSTSSIIAVETCVNDGH